MKTAAQGGRIGAFNGGIQGLMPQQGMPQQGIPQQGFMPQAGLMPPQGLNPRMGYALGDEVEQVTEEITETPENMQMADRDDIPDWYLMDFEKILNDFRIDNNGNNPSSINELEKWYRFKYGKAGEAQGGRIGYGHGGAHVLKPWTWGKDWGGPESEIDPTMIGTQDSLVNRTAIIKIKDAIDLYEMQIENADQLGELSQEAQADYDLKIKQLEALEQGAQGQAYGGRIGAQGGGIMPLLDMGGMEKDYRQEGGFVPIGRKEKADDVPARLSKNEFVFTADAVKAAGGGDIDEGAQRMYNVMKNLEAGGEISQQSQGQA